MSEAPFEFDVLIEIPAHSAPIKYEIDKESGALFVDRFLSTGMHYPCDYGYVSKSLNEHGSPLSALVITPIPVNQRCIIRCRAIGMLRLTDEEGKKNKILAVPINTLTDQYQHIQNYTDLPLELLQRISHFFAHYTELEEDRKVVVEGWKDAKASVSEVVAAKARYERPIKRKGLKA